MKKYLSLVLCVFVLTATANTAQAFDKKDLSKVKKTWSCIQCNLVGANLRKLGWLNVFGKVDLRSANLSRANLTKAKLRKALLTRADLSGANLTKAKLIKANLSGANLTKANLSGADLSGAYLTGANLTDANLFGANLTDANWTDDSKCGKGSIGKCVSDKKSNIPDNDRVRGSTLHIWDREFTKEDWDHEFIKEDADKKAKPYDIRGK